MEAVTLRLLPYAEADGPTNMAADEVLLQAAAGGKASLRCYGWIGATVSLGYFQPATSRLQNASLARLPWVRRPSGGATLVHHHELTYCLGLPAGLPYQAGSPWVARMHGIIAHALGALGLTGRLEAAERETRPDDPILCFRHFTPGDLLYAGHKVVGSAQRKQKQALMQHGSILLATSEHAPRLAGLKELANFLRSPMEVQFALVAAFRRSTSWEMQDADWTAAEKEEVSRLRREKYGSAGWNERR